MAMLHIKENHECSNMVANILPADPPTHHPNPWGGISSSLVQNMVMLHINLKRITNAATWKQIFYSSPPPPPPQTLGMRSIGPEHAHVSYQFKENHECSNMVPNMLPANRIDPNPGDCASRIKVQLFQNRVMLHIKLKRIMNAATLLQIFCPKTPIPWG